MELERQVVEFRGFVESGIPLVKKTFNAVGMLLGNNRNNNYNVIMRQVLDLTGLPVNSTRRASAAGKLPPLLIRTGTPALFSSLSDNNNDLGTLKKTRDTLIKRRDDHVRAVEILQAVLTKETDFIETFNPVVVDRTLPPIGSSFSSVNNNTSRTDVLRLPSVATTTTTTATRL